MIPGTLNVYTTDFGQCSGRVTALSLCYTPKIEASANETILTVIIISTENIIKHLHNVMVQPISDRNYCAGDMNRCCLTQNLNSSEQFTVVNNWHYGLRVYMDVSSPLQHNQQTKGYHWTAPTNLSVGASVPVSADSMMMPSPMFFFIINSCMLTNTCI